jgi:hypothetical protein
MVSNMPQSVAEARAVPAQTAVTRSAMLAIPGGPNILLDLEKGLESVLGILPTLAMFVPQLNIIIPFIPLIKAAIATAEDVQAHAGDGTDIIQVITEHMHSLADELEAVFKKK